MVCVGRDAESHSVTYRLFKVQRSIYKCLHEALRERHDLHPGQLPMLFFLSRNEGASQKEISKKLDLEPGTVAVMLRRLEKKGLVLRKVDENDRRIQRVYLTDLAKEILLDVDIVVKEIERRLNESMSSDELESFKRLLDKVFAIFSPKGADKGADDDV